MKINDVIVGYEKRMSDIQDEMLIAVGSWTKERLAELSEYLPGRRITLESRPLPEFYILPAINDDGDEYDDLEEICRKYPELLGENAYAIKSLVDDIRNQLIKFADEYADIEDVVYDPDELVLA